MASLPQSVHSVNNDHHKERIGPNPKYPNLRFNSPEGLMRVRPAAIQAYRKWFASLPRSEQYIKALRMTLKRMGQWDEARDLPAARRAWADGFDAGCGWIAKQSKRKANKLPPG